MKEQEIITKSISEEKYQETKQLEERIKRIETRYKKFKKIIFVITIIMSYITYNLGINIGKECSKDIKYKIDEEFDIFKNTNKNKQEKSVDNTIGFILDEKILEIAKIMMYDKYNISLIDNDVETPNKKLVKMI